MCSDKRYALIEICIVDDIQNECLQLSSNAEENDVVLKCCHPSFPPKTTLLSISMKMTSKPKKSWEKSIFCELE